MNGPVMPFAPAPPPMCPGCGKPESIKEVCAHCGYVYTESTGGMILGIVLIVVAILVMLWAFITVIEWASESPAKSLADVIRGQWRLISSMRVW